MALARLTTWSGGQVLTATALNAEFDNILTNPLALISTASVASKGLLLVGNATALIGLPVGSNTQVLTADSTQASGVKWAAVPTAGAPGFDTVTSGTNTVAAMIVGSGASLVPTGTGILRATDLIFGSDAKGDIAVRGTSAYGRIAVGTNTQVLTADSTQVTGLKWAAGGSTITSQTATVAAMETTTSNTFTDLATPGPSVTLTIGPSGNLLVTVTANMFILTIGSVVYMDFALSGGNTRSAIDATAAKHQGLNTTYGSLRFSVTTLLTGLSSTSTTITGKYHVDTAGVTGNWSDRSLVALTW